ncbi:tRNA (adenosine(37)-N6)-threonylcarbamoyltransferase complex dimerization subunit type 1 TsaB [Shewanella algae]|uniref:tRNA (adenosine(37)-N6)-threonylcarbamoyltransferase complex dimerization subunit type 1 TsaB n=1 Tax=Shewanella algae TaxID=38313 RepID=UPI001AAC4A0B|nr:tRNA (adenosine(37)-N6)-threonylcarbamoyltransferase complex dimerization subunit type 1 TsaB [Shewanella algae]MBO2654105.1 tRNA (adenosine(37)-N6)-threonylcarbamoyltransferase complex dimerization subunit type 1 TsaB [Shewanella algae]
MTSTTLANSPVILALDTCTELCSAALAWQDGSIAESVDAPREHSQRLLPMIENLLSQSGLKMQDIGLIAYGRGPGSFTGIRICTSMTQGLALGLDVPVIGISTLAAMAQQAITEHGAQQVICAIDARMGEIYWAAFEQESGTAKLVGIEQVSAPETMTSPFANTDKVYCCGTGFDAYPALLQHAENLTLLDAVKYPQASAMLALASLGWQQGQATSVDELAPVYLRDTVAWKKLPGRE